MKLARTIEISQAFRQTASASCSPSKLLAILENPVDFSLVNLPTLVPYVSVGNLSPLNETMHPILDSQRKTIFLHFSINIR